MRRLSVKVIFIRGILPLCFFVFFFSSCNNVPEKTNNNDTSKLPTVEVPGKPIKYDSSKKYIYLTWDDGPQPPGSNNCKNLFQEQNVKASFFIVGMNESSPKRVLFVDSLRKMYPQFLICNHTITHAFKENYKYFYKHADSAVGEIVEAQKLLNVPLKIVRLPGNNSWVGKGEVKGPKSTMDVCNKLNVLGYTVIGWDIEWQFKGGSVPKQSATEIIKEIQDKFENGYLNNNNHLVILAHDRMFQKENYVDSLRKVISTFKNDPNYVFETIDHYPLAQNK